MLLAKDHPWPCTSLQRLQLHGPQLAWHAPLRLCRLAPPLQKPLPGRLSSPAGCVVSTAFNPRLFHLPKKGGAEGEVEPTLSGLFALGSQDRKVSGEGGGQLACGHCCRRYGNV